MSENKIGLSKKDYVGSKSTLCTGCGHDSVTNHIITAYFASHVKPHQVAKLSGIGCSSKTPTYFMSQAHGFNAIHGRMAPLSIGVGLANKNLKLIGVSGDGDTASIGLTGFAHLIRRNLPIVYIIENNGVYGLTKGQFSATADVGSEQKSGEKNPFTSIDLCSMAIDLGCGFVARSFSGDAKQLVPILKAAIHHQGTAVIDVISPCITFANNEGSTKSFNYVKEHKIPWHELGFVDSQEDIKVDYEAGELQKVEMADGSIVTLKKIDHDFDVYNSDAAMLALRAARSKGQILTGLFHINEQLPDLATTLKLPNEALTQLNEQKARPSASEFAKILKSFS